MIIQDKSKFNAPKYRFVVRKTNKDIITQVTSAKLVGDQVLVAAYAHELPRYGLKVGLTNYAACYATGLLCARRLLQKVGLDKKYQGVKETDGNLFLVEHKGRARPFKAFADVGLQRTTTGARIFGAIKGACDGGLFIPHNNNRYPGYKKDADFDAKAHRERIYGVHVANYMKHLEKTDADAYKKQFSQYIAQGIKADQVEALYKKVHAAIRADPSVQKKAAKQVVAKNFNKVRLDLASRNQRVAVKKTKLMAKRALLEKERAAKRRAAKRDEKEEVEEEPAAAAPAADAKKGDAKADAKKGDAKADAKGGDKKAADAKGGDKKADAKKK